MITDFVAFLSPDWDVAYRASMFREIARQIGVKGGKFIGINRPVYILTDLFSNPRRILKTLEKSIKIVPNITICRPLLYVHPRAFPYGGNKLQKNKLSGYIKKVVRKEGAAEGKTVFWLSHPYQMLEVDIPDGVFVVYERYDKYDAAFNITEKNRKLIRALENKIFKKADLIIVTAKKLTEDIQEYSAKIKYLSNAADFEYFSECKSAKNVINKNIAHINHPVIGYLGTIHAGTDLKLIRKTALALPEYTFLLTGPVQDGEIKASSEYRSLIKMTNVIFTGWLDWAEMPTYLKAFDIGIIPYRLDFEFNNYVDPNKFHEYMAMGLPIVSTNIPEMLKYKQWASIANSEEEFISKIKEAVDKLPAKDRDAREIYARENGWAKRVGEILGEINKSI